MDVGFTHDWSAFPALGQYRYGAIENMDVREPVREIRPGFHEPCIGCVPIARRDLPLGGGGWFRLLGDIWWTSLSGFVRRCAAMPARHLV
ncbi:MAG: hypothetical protein OXC70_07910 [Gammaproteobacteria bacterium]|nr:hypothetical protein [Gammaproteobacteria bacterium]